MENVANQKAANKWLNVPIIATITRLLCRELTLQNEYLLRENKILKSKITKRINFTDDERRALVESAMEMARDLMEQVVTIVQPKTILAWQEFSRCFLLNILVKSDVESNSESLHKSLKLNKFEFLSRTG
jgi:hypothetical protein